MIDYVWGFVGKLTGTEHYFPKVVIKHEHNLRKGKAEWDATYKRLAPMQEQYHNGRQYKIAEIYAAILARNLVDAGVCKWAA